MGLCPLWFWLLNSLTVGLMEEEIRFLLLFNTVVPLAPALVAGQWAVWLEAGRCMVTRRGEQWAQCLSQHYLPASLSLLLGSFFLSNKSGWPIAVFCCGGGIHTLILTHTHTHTKKEGSQWGLEGLWVGKQSIALLSVQMWLNFSLYAWTTEEELLNMIFVLFFHIRIFISKKDDGDVPVCNGFYV